jgi:BlaR1 peptidase M56
MFRIETLLDAYFITNILLIMAFLLWSLARMVMQRTGHRYAYVAQLRLLNAVFVAIMAWPLAVVGFGALTWIGAVPDGFSLNAADFVVARYLDGQFTVNPSELERMLLLRDRLTTELLTLNTPLGIAIAVFAAAGFSFCTLRTMFGMLRLSRIIRRSYAWRRFGRVHLRLSDRISVPFSTRGWRNRYVVLPSAMLTDAGDMRMVLTHEFQHLRKSDLEWEIALELIRPLFFWNPVFHMWKRRVERLRELACDQQVVAMKHVDVKTYCSCLLKVCQASMRLNRARIIAVPRVALIDSNCGQSRAAAFLHQRIDAMFVGTTRAVSGRGFAAIFAPLAISIALAAIALQKSDDWSQDRIMLSTIINLDRLAARKGPSLGTPPPGP